MGKRKKLKHGKHNRDKSGDAEDEVVVNLRRMNRPQKSEWLVFFCFFVFSLKLFMHKQGTTR